MLIGETAKLTQFRRHSKIETHSQENGLFALKVAPAMQTSQIHFKEKKKENLFKNLKVL